MLVFLIPADVSRNLKMPLSRFQRRRLWGASEIIAAGHWAEPSADLFGNYRVVFIPDYLGTVRSSSCPFAADEEWAHALQYSFD
jgi:hypothetical protein